ncbi:16 kDa beta-galactoside-binding lectin-like [Hemicordylus capensis]|uniref:16 kDa beta-galactoside-binding lectin-like n=1 Tax=Hemicordylus capensis TaxID=884348 RepID=UPI00230385DF|nr:16 kDa beta-galactoside-binding lectin-like [Hemicordylus capensis]
MDRVLSATGLNIQRGDGLQLCGKLLPEAKDFHVDLGEDSVNFMLHFSLRFDSHGDRDTVICCFKQKGLFGAEEQRAHFPIQRGQDLKATFTFGTPELKVKVEEPVEMRKREDTPMMEKAEKGSCMEQKTPDAPVTHHHSQWEMEMVFPNRLVVKPIQDLVVKGDFKFQGLRILSL